MSKLNIDQKTIEQLFSDPELDFLTPDYQRPYAWPEVERRTLRDDIFLLRFLKIIVIISGLPMNISSVRSLHLRMRTASKKTIKSIDGIKFISLIKNK